MRILPQFGGLSYPYRWAESSWFTEGQRVTLSLQFGYGMMAHSVELIRAWGGGATVLSPRDLNREQLGRTAERVQAVGGEVLLDPQCYLRQADHTRLTQHEYFQLYQAHATGALLGGAATAEFIEAVRRLNDDLGTARLIVPGLLADQVDDDWAALQASLVEEAERHRGAKPIFATIALGSLAMRDMRQVERCLDEAEDWEVDGCYVVLESPGAYLVSDPTWMANALVLCAGLRLLGMRVLLAYANHQMLAAACANVDELASGTWLNVRAFSPEKFLNPEAGSVSRRTLWYYCPHSFSEYKIPFLDIAARQGVLSQMAPQPPLPDTYCRGLFSGALPTGVGWTEQYAFRHYLTCLRAQGNALEGLGDYDATVTAYRQMLATARSEIASLERAGVLGSQRSFADCIDANLSALAVLESNYGPSLRTDWT